MSARLLILPLCLLFVLPCAGQTPARTKPRKEKGVDPVAEQRRELARSLVSALAEEARAFRDERLRARVQARAADLLWSVDRERARDLFRRAWEAAEAADADAERRRNEEMRRQASMTATRATSLVVRSPNLRAEVLSLAARRDRALGEEFLSRMAQAKKGGAGAPPQDPPESVGQVPPAVTQRLQLAETFLNAGDIGRALQFADPALDRVNIYTINFLCRLREKDQTAADARFRALLARIATDPTASANTVSISSSYLFSPYTYVVFYGPWPSVNRFDKPRMLPAPSPELIARFMETAAQILLRPLPPPDQDRGRAERAERYMVISRLLPLFEQHAPEQAALLRDQLAALLPDVPDRARNTAMERTLKTGLVPDEESRPPIEELLDRAEREPAAQKRDSIYVQAANVAASEGDERARDIVARIGDDNTRQRARAFIDFALVRFMINKKRADDALRLLRTSEVAPLQRAVFYGQVAALLTDQDRGRAIELLEEALAQARRMERSDPDRARALLAVATRFAKLDQTRAWEVASEAVKAVNAATDFDNETTMMTSVASAESVMFTSFNADEMSLTPLFAQLAREDLNRAIELARSLTGEAPRAEALLSIARAELESA